MGLNKEFHLGIRETRIAAIVDAGAATSRCTSNPIERARCHAKATGQVWEVEIGFGRVVLQTQDASVGWDHHDFFKGSDS